MLDTFYNFTETTDSVFLIYSLIVIIFLLLTYNLFIHRKINRRISSIPGLDLNNKLVSALTDLDGRTKALEIFRSETRHNLDSILDSLKEVKTIKTLKYNPYADMGVGGNQSWSSAILDKKGNGIIITSLYSRDKSRVMVKNIKSFMGEQELSPEEKEVLNMAK